MDRLRWFVRWNGLDCVQRLCGVDFSPPRNAYTPGRYPAPKWADDSLRKSEINDISDVVPPSTTIVCPTMNSASSQQRKTAASRPISSGVPAWPTGIALLAHSAAATGS